MHTDYCYKHTIHEMTVFLDEVIFFLTDDSRQLTAIAYIIDINDIKHVINGYIFHPQIKGHNLSFINS